MKLIHYILILYIMYLLVTVFASCNKIVQVSPPVTSITGASVYNSDATAIAVLTGIYTKISSTSPSTLGSIPSLSLFSSMSADELTLWNGIFTNLSATAYYRNA